MSLYFVEKGSGEKMDLTLMWGQKAHAAKLGDGFAVPNVRGFVVQVCENVGRHLTQASSQSQA